MAAGLSIPARVAAHVMADPLRTEVEDGQRRFTYAELDHGSAAIASALLDRDVQPDDRVAVCLPRSWEAIVAFLGVLRAGAAYVPVNPDLPALRQRELVELAAARVTLTGPAEERRLPSELVRLDVGRLAGGDAEHITAAIEPSTCDRVRDEFLVGEGGISDVAVCQTVAADPELANGTRRQRSTADLPERHDVVGADDQLSARDPTGEPVSAAAGLDHDDRALPRSGALAHAGRARLRGGRRRGGSA